MLCALREAGFAGPKERPAMQPISGGVSSTVLRIDLAGGPVCAKRVLSQLKVAAEWKAPVERALSEVAWVRLVRGLDPRLVPEILLLDEARHLFVMTYLDPASHPCWKTLLADGAVDAAFAASVGDALGRIHAHTAHSAACARAFANERLFHPLRVDPYLLHTARAHPELATEIERIAEALSGARIALMHGDVSPKNILVGSDGPVFLDSECASFGDPAFDLAFCLNHLLLKSVWHPEYARAYAAAFDALNQAYFARADWEDRAGLDTRTARLLPALLLARIDGKSPVEYLTAPAQKDFVRGAARDFLRRLRLDIASLRSSWNERLAHF